MKLGRMQDLIKVNVFKEFHKNWFTPSWSFIQKIDQILLKVTMSIYQWTGYTGIYLLDGYISVDGLDGYISFGRVYIFS